MSNFEKNDRSRAELLIDSVFRGREAEADTTIARLRLGHRLDSVRPAPRLRNSIKVMAVLTGLLLLGSWASGLPVHSMDDAQQITLMLPGEWSIDQYNYYTALFANRSNELKELGGHSLVVDALSDAQGKYYLQLGILGINYTEANEWIRQVMIREPELVGSAYSITQPMVPYSLTVRDMLAFKLGSTIPIESNVVRAWYSVDKHPSHIYLISRADGNFRTTQRLLY